MKKVLAVIGVLTICVCASDVYAMCGMGGGGRGRGGSGGIGVSTGSGTKSADKKTSKLSKPAMPEAASVAALNTSQFDSMASLLGLSSDQQTKVSVAKAEIQQAISRLTKAQTDARIAYTKADTTQAYLDAAKDVLGAAEICKSFNANQQFESLVANILTADQRAKYRQLLAKS